MNERIRSEQTVDALFELCGMEFNCWDVRQCLQILDLLSGQSRQEQMKVKEFKGLLLSLWKQTNFNNKRVKEIKEYESN